MIDTQCVKGFCYLLKLQLVIFQLINDLSMMTRNL